MIKTIPYIEFKSGKYPKNKVKKDWKYIEYPQANNCSLKIRGIDVTNFISWFEIKGIAGNIIQWQIGMKGNSIAAHLLLLF